MRHRRIRPRYGRIGVASAALLVTLVAVVGGLGLPGGAPGQPAAQTVWLVDHHLVPAAPPDSTRSLRDQVAAPVDPALPPESGRGRRVVFDMSDQRVWLVAQGERVLRSYLVSGSVYDNLDPGTYSVYSRSRWANGIDSSGQMEFFVRFTHGARAAIGFHSIPALGGQLVQPRSRLGTPQSHGCIRQARDDARRLWAFAPVGTRVVVTA